MEVQLSIGYSVLIKGWGREEDMWDTKQVEGTLPKGIGVLFLKYSLVTCSSFREVCT